MFHGHIKLMWNSTNPSIGKWTLLAEMETPNLCGCTISEKHKDILQLFGVCVETSKLLLMGFCSASAPSESVKGDRNKAMFLSFQIRLLGERSIRTTSIQCITKSYYFLPVFWTLTPSQLITPPARIMISSVRPWSFDGMKKLYHKWYYTQY